MNVMGPFQLGLFYDCMTGVNLAQVRSPTLRRCSCCHEDRLSAGSRAIPSQRTSEPLADIPSVLPPLPEPSQPAAWDSFRRHFPFSSLLHFYLEIFSAVHSMPPAAERLHFLICLLTDSLDSSINHCVAHRNQDPRGALRARTQGASSDGSRDEDVLPSPELKDESPYTSAWLGCHWCPSSYASKA